MIFVDSSFLIAYHNDRDAHHSAALEVLDPLLSGQWGPAMVLEYVFLEVTTVLAMRRDLETAVRVGEVLLNAEELEFVPSSASFLKAFEVFRRQDRDRLSFVDAALVAIARQRDARYVLTFDSGFRGVEGLTVVPG